MLLYQLAIETHTHTHAQKDLPLIVPPAPFFTETHIHSHTHVYTHNRHTQTQSTAKIKGKHDITRRQKCAYSVLMTPCCDSSFFFPSKIPRREGIRPRCQDLVLLRLSANKANAYLHACTSEPLMFPNSVFIWRQRGASGIWKCRRPSLRDSEDRTWKCKHCCRQTTSR